MKAYLLFFTIILSFFAGKLNAQTRNSISAGLGIQGKSISILYHLNDYKCIEAMFIGKHNKKRFTITALYEESHSIGNNFEVFGGTGLHVGFRKIPVLREVIVYKINDLVIKRTILVNVKKFVAGADVIGGINYNISQNIFLRADVKPYVDFINKEDILLDASVRFGITL